MFTDMSVTERFRDILRWLHVLGPRKNILIIGFDASGKTSLINALANGRPFRTETPTIGMKIEVMETSEIRFTTICMPCTNSDKTFVLTRYFAKLADAVIWVCPKNHLECLEGGKHRVNFILDNLPVRNTPVLILCNETEGRCYVDVDPGPFLSLVEIENQIGNFDCLRQYPWQCFDVDLKNGRGLVEALIWLENVLRDQGVEMRLTKYLKSFAMPPLIPPKQVKRIVILGAMGSGKTTLIKLLANGSPIESTQFPIGTPLEVLKKPKVAEFITIDVPLARTKSWLGAQINVKSADGLIWVCPKNHAECLRRLELSQQLRFVFDNLDAEQVPVLILCNRSRGECEAECDTGSFMSVEAIDDQIGVSSFLDPHPCRCFDVDLKNGWGIQEAFQWQEDIFKDMGMDVRLTKDLRDFGDVDLSEKF